LEYYNKNPGHPYLPTKICVIDKNAGKMAIEEGLPRDRILITGNPHFEMLLKKYSRIEANPRCAAKRRKIHSHNKFHLVFVSEPFEDVYGKKRARSILGYSEFGILTALITAIQKVIEKSEFNVSMFIKTHPRENPDKFDRFIKTFQGRNICLESAREADPVELVYYSDLVCGMQSMLLIEAAIVGKTVYSIQINARNPDQFILHKTGNLRSILTYSELTKRLRCFFSGSHEPQKMFQIIKNPVENIATVLGEYQCLN
jgi:UDP-N-acetylglucosamine 2-epimerase